MSAILKEDPRPIAGSGKNVPPELERIVERCLAKNAAQRFHSAHDLAFALTSLLSGGQAVSPLLPVSRASSSDRG